MKLLTLLLCITMLFSCDSKEGLSPVTETEIIDFSDLLAVDFSNLENYENQTIPNYITGDNTNGNIITNEVATLGRILFYDKNLSIDNTIACASCHKQELAFSDDNSQSIGVDGLTGRHSMRLVNARFSNEAQFFWDERANTLEEQTTMPIQDHLEMGFSGEEGDLDFNDLIAKLQGTAYYPDLFNLAFGDNSVSEERIQNALAQFIRSIQSFDSKYDAGRTNTNNDGQPFANFTTQENLGKQLFLQPPVFNTQSERINGGIGCAGCHQAPEFSIDPNSRNNGVIGTADQTGLDLNVTRAPTLRDIVSADGSSNGPFMHIGVSNTLATVLNHYNSITINGNTDLDPRLRPNGIGQQLNLTTDERNAVIAFLRTLTGSDIYTNQKWSDPFIEQ
jgi:cytochrome c peroxidase